MKKNSVHFIGYYFEESFFEENISKFFLVPFASNRLQKSFLDYFYEEYHQRLKITSFLPVTDYPKSDFFLGKVKEYQAYKGIKISSINFINVLGVKHITKFLGLYGHLFKDHLFGGDKAYFVYNLNNAILTVLWFLNLIRRREVVVIIADMPMAAMPDEGVVKRVLRAVDRKLVRRMIKSFAGLIVLSEYTAKDFFSSMKYAVIEGSLNDKVDQNYRGRDIRYSSGNTTSITYIGRLSSSQNVDDLVIEFISCKRNDLRLVLCGKGELEPWIRERAGEDERIILKGFVPNDELVRIIDETSYFISPKKEDGYFSRYSFPSKLIEYMAYGKPVVSYKLSCIPAEYYPHMIFLGEQNNAYLHFFQSCSSGDKEHRGIGCSGKKFVLTRKTGFTQFGKIDDLMGN